MKVRLKPNITNTDLNEDSIYNVLCIEIGDKIEFYLQKYFNYGDIYLVYPYLSDLFDIVDNDIKNWSIKMFEKNICSNANFDEIKQIKYMSIAPKEINYESFCEDIAECYGLEKCDYAHDMMARACGLYANLELNEESFIRIFSEFQLPNLEHGIDIGEDYIMCPKCSNAIKNNKKGVIKCHNQYCNILYNNPQAKPTPKGVKIIVEKN